MLKMPRTNRALMRLRNGNTKFLSTSRVIIEPLTSREVRLIDNMFLSNKLTNIG